MSKSQKYKKGLALRKEVLDCKQVEAITKASQGAVNEEFQHYLNEFVWGEIWHRPSLDRKERSLITLGILTALSKEVELKTHIQAAFNNGLSEGEIKEVFLHSMVYCGFPAAMSSLRIMRQVVEDKEGSKPRSK